VFCDKLDNAFPHLIKRTPTLSHITPSLQASHFPPPISRALPIFFPLRLFPTKSSQHSHHLDSIHPFYTIPSVLLYQFFQSGHHDTYPDPDTKGDICFYFLTIPDSILSYVTIARNTSIKHTRDRQLTRTIGHDYSCCDFIFA
jgi:hypothetical protein